MSSNENTIQRLILNTHLWLGICAAVCTWGSFVLLQQTVPIQYLAFVMTGTMTIYTYHGYQTRKEARIDTKTDQTSIDYLKFVSILGSIATALLYLTLERTTQVILLFPAAMAVLYVLPLFRGRRLKEYPFIKIIAIVLAWTVITYGIPVHQIPRWWTDWGYNLLMLDRIFFFFALAIPFDIRDIDYDNDRSIRTIPNTIGVENSQNLALFSIFLCGGFMAMGFEKLELQDPVRIGILALYLLIGVMIIQLKNRPGNGYYSWLIDGFLLLYGLTIFLLSR